MAQCTSQGRRDSLPSCCCVTRSALACLPATPPPALRAPRAQVDAATAREEEERGNAMKALENRTLDSKREMDILSALDEMKSLKVGARRGRA